MYKVWFIICTVISLLFLGWHSPLTTNSVQVAALPLDIQPTPIRPSPPPLETPPATPPNTPLPEIPTTTSSDTSQPVIQSKGAWIWLTLESTSLLSSSQRANIWTVVQWQDANGNWHNVTGWRGTLDEVYPKHGHKVWWLSEDLFGAGPFRWVVCRDQKAAVLTESQEFYLPQSSGETTKITVLLP